jgi:hypothetical protein
LRFEAYICGIMRRNLSFVFVHIALAVAPATVSAQTITDTTHAIIRFDTTGGNNLVGIPNGARVSFDRLLSVYEWTGRLDYVVPSMPRIAPYPYVTTDSVQFTGDSRYLEDDAITTTAATGYINADWPIYLWSNAAGSQIRPFTALYGASYITTGLSQEADATNITKQVGGFGVIGPHFFSASNGIDATAAAGFAQAEQLGINATGGIMRGTFYTPTLPVTDNTLLSASSLVDERFYAERSERYSNDRASFAAVSALGNTVSPDSNHAYLTAGLSRQDFFFAADSTDATVKQERTALSMLLFDSLNYPIVDRTSAGTELTGTINVLFAPQSISRTSDLPASELTSSGFADISSLLVPSQVSDLHIATAGRLDFQLTKKFLASAQMSYDDNSENVSLLSNEIAGVDPSLLTKFSETLNASSYSERTTIAGGSMRYSPNTRDVFQVSIGDRLLNYDTPSALNDDDHDELISTASADYTRYFSDQLNAGLDLRGTRTHLVYLMSDRSAQNNVSQSLSLTSHADYVTPTMFARASGQVYATYTVLDYLDSIPSIEGIGNYVLRGMTLSDTLLFPTGIRLFHNTASVTIEEGASLQVDERGSYDVPSFSEQLDTRTSALSAALLAGLTDSSGAAPWSVHAGVRAFVLSRDGQNTVSLSAAGVFEELERQTRIGPVVVISLLRSNGIGPMLIASLWYSGVKDQTYDIPSLSYTHQLESYLTAQWIF